MKTADPRGRNTIDVSPVQCANTLEPHLFKQYGRVRETRDVQRINALLPISVNALGNAKEVSLRHPQNVSSGIVDKSSGRVIDVSEVHRENAWALMRVTESGNARCLSPVHRLNALKPILVNEHESVNEVRSTHLKNAWECRIVTVLGRTAEVRPQPSKVRAFIAVKELGSVSEESLSQRMNAADPISLIVFGSVMEVRQLQCENDLDPRLVTPAGSRTEVRAV